MASGDALERHRRTATVGVNLPATMRPPRDEPTVRALANVQGPRAASEARHRASAPRQNLRRLFDVARPRERPTRVPPTDGEGHAPLAQALAVLPVRALVRVSGRTETSAGRAGEMHVAYG